MDQETEKARNDSDPQETQEWLESLQAVIQREGAVRAHYLLEQLVDYTRRSGGHLPYDATTAYINTIPAQQGARHPGNTELEYRIRSIIRWNAMATVVRASKRGGELGGHIASFASAATLYDVGFNHFSAARSIRAAATWSISRDIPRRAFTRAPSSKAGSPNSSSTAFGRSPKEAGLSSYPHPWLMPDFWQFPTVSMGLGPIMAIYQARFLKYLHDRGIADTADRKVWCFLGDGETDEPESLGAISLAGREKLSNLIFVVNCNLQRLDGPVRGNGKIIQELEGVFRGAGWNVLKVIWGSYWDKLFAKDHKGLLRKRMEEAVDGEYQNYKAKGGAYTREHFFGKYPELREMVATMTDQDIWRLNRGGHDPHKIYAAYSEAMSYTKLPTVILAKTVKGYGMGGAGEAQNITHQQKKMDTDSVRQFRDRFGVPIPDDKLDDVPYYHPGEDSEEIRYLLERRKALGGFVPQRRRAVEPLEVPGLEAFESLLKSTGEREISTTMAFVRCLTALLRDKRIAERVVPIVADEARTFGMEGMFRQLGIYSSVGQLYTPVDSDQLMFYKEDQKGQILQEGITEAGAFSSWIAAATSYSTSGVPMIPFFIFYSMFGFQRVGDLAWAAGDMRARGFLIGGTAGRTTLNGEGLQHEDGNSHMISAMVPNCVSYDPTFAYELAVIVQDGLRRMYQEGEDVYYYITVENENYPIPTCRRAPRRASARGFTCCAPAPTDRKRSNCWARARSCAKPIAAANILEQDFGVVADIWSATSFTELRREGRGLRALEPAEPGKGTAHPWVTQCLKERRARSSPRPITCGPSPTRSAASCPRKTTSCWAPTASGGRTPASS
jgi:pyruvate dehydrogenase E1 component